MSFENETFDVVISSAVLHFASDEEQWDAMLRGTLVDPLKTSVVQNTRSMMTWTARRTT